MDDKKLEKLRTRADAKLRYAEIHLSEIVEAREIGSDFERAHLESYLFHLFGARDAFLAELIEYYSLPSNTEVRFGEIRKTMKGQGKSSPELGELSSLGEDDGSRWYVTMKSMRDHVTHIGAVTNHITVYLGSNGDKPTDREIVNPKTDELVKFVEIAKWLDEMKSLLDRLRKSAIESTNK